MKTWSQSNQNSNGETKKPVNGSLEELQLARSGARIPEGLYLKAAETRRKIALDQWRTELAPGLPGSVNWTPLGPSVLANGSATGNPPVSGRINGIAAGPGSMRVYAGADSGGVWFSADGGSTWTPLDDYAVSPSYTTGLDGNALGVDSIAVAFGATAATDVIFVATGSGNNSIGIKHSVNGGAPGTWTLEATNLAGLRIFRVIVDPDDATKAYAATNRGLYRRPAMAPFTTWTHVTGAFTNSFGFATDVIAAGSGISKRFYAAFAGDKIYVSTDFSAWSAVAGPSLAGTSRIVLAAGESDPTAVYLLSDTAILQRLVSGSFQTVTGMPASALFSEGQGAFDVAIAVDPTNPGTIYLAGDATGANASLFKGALAGSPGSYSFPFNAANTGNPSADPTWIGNRVHPDVHTLAFALNVAGTAHDPTSVWVGCDGGLFQSNASGAVGTFAALNTGLATLLVARMGQRPDTDSTIFGGMMDNGILRVWGEEAGFAIRGGDGGGVAVNPSDPYQMMVQLGTTGLLTTTDGSVSGSWFSAMFPPSGNATESSNTFSYTPIAVTPAGVAPVSVAFGTNRLWYGTPSGPPGAEWSSFNWVTLPTNTNPYGGGPPNLAQDVLDGPVITSSFASSTRIYAATTKHVYRFDFSGVNWSQTTITTAGLPVNFSIFSLAVDNAAGGSFYVTLAGNGYDHVWYFDGAAWHTAGLAKATLDVPVQALVVDPANPLTPTPMNPQYVYAGSDVGVWKGVRTGASAWSWSLFSQGLPEASVTDLAFHARTRLLRAALWGRGIWEIAVDATMGQDPDIYMRVNYADTGRIVGGNRYPWVDAPAPDPTAKGHFVYHWFSSDIKVRRGSLGGLPSIGAPPNFLDFAFNIGDYIESTTHTETADISGTDRIFVEVHNRGLTAVPAGQVRVLLLLADAFAGPPALPANYAAHINAGDTAWLGGSSWFFADPGTPYRYTPGILDARTPQVVEFDVDFSTLALPAGHDHVCAAAFISTTTSADQLSAVNAVLDQVTMQDKHIAQRNLHLVPAGAKPLRLGGERLYEQLPQTMLLDFHNPEEEPAAVDLVFDRTLFPGHLSLMLPKLTLVHGPREALADWTVQHHSALEIAVREHLGRWLDRVGDVIEQFGEKLEQAGAALEGQPRPEDIRERRIRKIAGIDRSQVYVAKDSSVPTIRGVRIPAGGLITAAITIQAPGSAKPGDRFRFDAIQRGPVGEILGGSSYFVAVVKAKED